MIYEIEAHMKIAVVLWRNEERFDVVLHQERVAFGRLRPRLEQVLIVEQVESLFRDVHLAGNASCLQPIRDARVLRPDVVLPFARADHAGHDAARVDADSHVDVQIVPLRPDLANVADHSQAQFDAVPRVVRIVLGNARHAVVAVAQKLDPQHVEFLGRLVELHEELVQHLDQRLHRQLRRDLRVVHDVRIQHADAFVVLNVQLTESKSPMLFTFHGMAEGRGEVLDWLSTPPALRDAVDETALELLVINAP